MMNDKRRLRPKRMLLGRAFLINDFTLCAQSNLWLNLATNSSVQYNARSNILLRIHCYVRVTTYLKKFSYY